MRRHPGGSRYRALTSRTSPDYALWYGWSEAVQDLTEIEAMAEEMRRAKGDQNGRGWSRVEASRFRGKRV